MRRSPWTLTMAATVAATLLHLLAAPKTMVSASPTPEDNFPWWTRRQASRSSTSSTSDQVRRGALPASHYLATPDAFVGRDVASRRSATNTGATSAAAEDDAFDYLILGGGTAGLALATRLSQQNASRRVGVLEAGPSALDDAAVNVPGLWRSTLGGRLDWNYTTQAGNNGVPSIPWPRGKVLGGSSALNFLVYDRASRSEYDAWEQLGNPGWNWTSLYRAMRKSETYTPLDAQTAALLQTNPPPSDYGARGPLQVSFSRYTSEVAKRWVPSLLSLGFVRNDRNAAGNNVGAFQQPSIINPFNSTRSYSATAYWVPNSFRPNLVVLPNAHVQRINFAPRNASDVAAVAVSVTFSSPDGVLREANLRSNGGEVIVSGGSVGTPQILELSGIGDANRLASLGIESVVDLPSVGENLQDHTYAAVVFQRNDSRPTFDTLQSNATFLAEQLALYAANQTTILDAAVPSISYLTLPQLVGAGEAAKLVASAKAYVATQRSKPYYPTLLKQLDFLTRGANSVAQIEVIGADANTSPFPLVGPPAPANATYTTLLAAQQHPFARGSIHIRSADANVAPDIVPNYFTNDFDVRVASAGTAYLRRIASTAPLSGILSTERLPGKDVVDVTNFTVTHVGTEYHPIGTASMLPRDAGGVVDPTLRVYGTQNVRVCDASVAPLQVSAHIQTLAYAVAEMAAGIIKTGVVGGGL